MKTLSRQKSTVLLYCLMATGLLLTKSAFADNDSMNCPGTLSANHVTLAAGDQNGANHLQLIRKIEAGAEFDLDICAADVTLTGSDGNLLRVTVDLESPSQQHTAADYLQKLDITPNHVKLQLHLMHALHAKVTIELPAATPELTLNLGRGDLTLVADTIGGERKINVGYGHVNFQGNADAYESMNVNIGLGSLHDNRKDGQNHHFIVARSFDGTGKGSIEMNVGMGGVDLNPGQNKPI
jgi:hypothetical protein